MVTANRILGIAGFLLILGACNDTATYPEIGMCVIGGLSLMGMAYILHHMMPRKCFRMHFISKENKDRIILAYSRTARAKAIRDLESQGYILYTEAKEAI